MPYLRFQTGDKLRLEGREMPGVLVAVEVDGENAIEQLPREGRAGDVPVYRGFRDFRVRLRIALAGEHPLEEAKILHAAFVRYKDKPLRVVHPHLAARGVEKALFSRLITRERADGEGVECELELLQTESRPAQREANARAQAAAGGSGTTSASPQAGPPPNSPQARRNPPQKPQPSPPRYIQDFLSGRQTGLNLVDGP